MAKIAGIDVHKKLLVVVIADDAAPEQILEQGKFGSVRSELERLQGTFVRSGRHRGVMESTAQYWRPVWNQLEGAEFASGDAQLPRPQGTQVGLYGCATAGQALRGGRIVPQPRARTRDSASGEC